METECCAICLDVLGADSHTLPCGHAFHTDCILSWARSDSVHHALCPVCRGGGPPVAVDDEEMRGASNAGMGWTNAAGFARLMRALQDYRPALGDEERALMDRLTADADRAVRADRAAREELAAHRRAHTEALRREKQLARRRWDTSWRVTQARRALATLFPVVHVVVPVVPERRATRRSARLAWRRT